MSLIFSRNFILQTSPVPVAFPLAPAFSWRNLFRDGDVTVSSAQAAHPAALAFDGFTSTGRRTVSGSEHCIEVELSQAAEADYAAIAAHTLQGCEAVPQHHDGSDWRDAASPVNIPSNAPLVWLFEPEISNRWRLRITGAPDVIALGAVHIGRRTTPLTPLLVGWQPPKPQRGCGVQLADLRRRAAAPAPVPAPRRQRPGRPPGS